MSRLKNSVGFALNGLFKCFKQEPNFRIHAVFTIWAIAAGLFFRISNVEWIIIVLCIAAVITTELINTAIEELCNMIQKEQHPTIKIIKDMAAAAVLITAIAAAISGAIIFIPKVISFINR
ncbi:MAG: diacylglycerol kinase family protein [Ferruginibacter sp.]